jgi:2'-5' RNA ligase
VNPGVSGKVKRGARVVGVVLQIPEAVARIADRIRRHYDPNFALIGPHVTVLPPRLVLLTRREVLLEVRRVAKLTPPLTLSLGPIHSFLPVMPVVFASVRTGTTLLIRLHRRLGGGVLKGAEAFPYVPHLTLGQGLESGRLRRALVRSRTLFGRTSSISWRVDRLIVVERRSQTVWTPLPPIRLNSGRSPIGERPGLPPRTRRSRP